MTLGTTLLSVVRSRVLAHLERCGCPILYPLVPQPFRIFPEILKNFEGFLSGGENFSFFPKQKLFREKPNLSVKTEIIASVGTTLRTS